MASIAAKQTNLCLACIERKHFNRVADEIRQSNKKYRIKAREKKHM